MSKTKMINNYIYFYHLNEFCILPLYPESVQDQLNSSFKETNALARTAPVFTYSNSGPRTVNMNFSLHRDLMNDLNKGISNLTNIEEVKASVNKPINYTSYDYIELLINHLQAIALPTYAISEYGSKGIQPPMVAVRLGDNIFIKGVVNSGVTVTYKKPIERVGNQDKYACVDINFTISEIDPYDAKAVVEKGSFRGITSSAGGRINDMFARSN